MIGVIADGRERSVVREFFELFKTPWEFYQEGPHYDVVISAVAPPLDGSAKVVLFYAGRWTSYDHEHKLQTGIQQRGTVLSHLDKQIPIYGDSITFPEEPSNLLSEKNSNQSAAFVTQRADRTIVRIGYDLFTEIRMLLTIGQPTSNASIPTLDLHIALLRRLIIDLGASLIEIPPVPHGYDFVACLTHDVDHPAIRKHRWDHTVLGFLYRATFGSLRDLIRRRMSLQDLLTNWMAVAKLPFVHAGLAEDFWRTFDDRYLKLEEGLSSTFFVIPFKDRPGMCSLGPAPRFRGSRYGAADIADKIRKLRAARCEVALHGIDTWFDLAKGREEIEEIRSLTGASEVGVRMHWLYFDEQSPSVLEKAGATYDSTIGYNETVGYRAGTTQVYKPLTAKRLLELPLHAMDTAMFYPAYLDLSPAQASARLAEMAEQTVQYGGCLTINWHDRSVAPERLWGKCYSELIAELRNRGAWFATAGQAVSWFRKRRSIVFEGNRGEPDAVRAAVETDLGDSLPNLKLRIHKREGVCGKGASLPARYLESVLNGARVDLAHEVAE